MSFFFLLPSFSPTFTIFTLPLPVSNMEVTCNWGNTKAPALNKMTSAASVSHRDPWRAAGGNYSGAEWLFPLREARDEAAPVIQLNNGLRTVRGINLGDKTLCNSIVGFLVLWLSSVITWSSYVMRLLTGHRLLSIFKGNGIMWWLHTHTHTNQHTDVIFS